MVYYILEGFIESIFSNPDAQTALAYLNDDPFSKQPMFVVQENPNLGALAFMGAVESIPCMEGMGTLYLARSSSTTALHPSTCDLMFALAGIRKPHPAPHRVYLVVSKDTWKRAEYRVPVDKRVFTPMCVEPKVLLQELKEAHVRKARDNVVCCFNMDATVPKVIHTFPKAALQSVLDMAEGHREINVSKQMKSVFPEHDVFLYLVKGLPPTGMPHPEAVLFADLMTADERAFIEISGVPPPEQVQDQDIQRVASYIKKHGVPKNNGIRSAEEVDAYQMTSKWCRLYQDGKPEMINALLSLVDIKAARQLTRRARSKRTGQRPEAKKPTAHAGIALNPKRPSQAALLLNSKND